MTHNLIDSRKTGKNRIVFTGTLSKCEYKKHAEYDQRVQDFISIETVEKLPNVKKSKK